MNKSGKTILKFLFVASILAVMLQLLFAFGTLIPAASADTVETQGDINNDAPTINGTEIEGGNADIDLTEGTTYTAYCTGTVNDTNGYGDVVNLTGVFFNDADSTNDYTWVGTTNTSILYHNTSCTMTNQVGQYADGRCDFAVQYYASNGTWKCNLTATDIANEHGSTATEDAIEIEDLIALDVPATLNFGTLSVGDYSAEKTVTVTNSGNTNIDILLDAYGADDGDGNSMNCTGGGVKNITLASNSMKYNSTQADQDFDVNMTAITDTAVAIATFDLYQSDASANSTKATYWMLNVPTGVEGTCRGILTFGVQSGY